MEPLAGIIGQERALRALQFGLSMENEGFNIYVAGWPGTGRTSAVMSFLGEVAKGKPTPPDWCYVNNFVDPYYPKAIRLPAGQAKQFTRDVHALVGEIRRRIPLAFESEQYAQKREAVVANSRRTAASRFCDSGTGGAAEGLCYPNVTVGPSAGAPQGRACDD